jgi:TRAP-type C4-dicarboxylate transport system permease small subunit
MSETHTPPLTDAPRRPWLASWCDASATTGAVVLVLMAIMTVVSVMGRAFFSHPILGDVELVQLGSAVVVSCFLPYTQLRSANIMVDFFTQHASSQRKHSMDVLGNALYTAMMGLIGWRVAVGGIDMRAAGESSMLMNLPLWWAYVLMLPGLGLSVLIGLTQTVDMCRTPASEVSA